MKIVTEAEIHAKTNKERRSSKVGNRLEWSGFARSREGDVQEEDEEVNLNLKGRRRSDAATQLLLN